jgi:hypothetical protein
MLDKPEGPGWWLAIVGMCILICFFLILIYSADAHEDSWINKGAFKNGAGEWCCGDYDCTPYSKFTTEKDGWRVHNGAKGEELIPYSEALPFAPPDGGVTVCRRPDGSRRCVFGIKPGT